MANPAKRRLIKKISPTMGKIKMLLQCFGIIFLLFYILSGAAFWLPVATYTLYAAVVFALLSLLVYRSV